MLEFLGFIALIAIMFGVSFGDALGGFVKFVVIGICALIALGIGAKILSTKSGAVFMMVASAAIVLLGVLMINDDYNKRYSYCYSIKDEYLYQSCALNAMSDHNESVNMGWGYAIGGGIVGLISLSVWSELNGVDKKKPATKKH